MSSNNSGPKPTLSKDDQNELKGLVARFKNFTDVFGLEPQTSKMAPILSDNPRLVNSILSLDELKTLLRLAREAKVCYEYDLNSVHQRIPAKDNESLNETRTRNSKIERQSEKSRGAIRNSAELIRRAEIEWNRQSGGTAPIEEIMCAWDIEMEPEPDWVE